MNNLYLQLFLTFCKIGAFTFGGGWAMISIIQREIVERHKWIELDEFLDLLAVAQSMPGILAVNISVVVGDRLKGIKGSICAAIGTILPSFLMILASAIFLTPDTIKNNAVVSRIFKGIRPAVVALIAVPMLKMAKESNHSVLAWSVTAVTLGLIVFLKVSPVYVLLVSIAVAVCLSWWRERREGLRK